MFSQVRNFGGALVGTALVVALAAPAAAQGFDPRVVEFLPVDRSARYDIELTAAGSGQPLQRVSLGTPAADADGMVRINVAAQLQATPVAGTTYVARVLAVGPQGTTVSVASNPFTFSRCQVGLTAAGAALPAAGGRGTVDVATSAGACAWTAVSSAAWLQVVNGAAGRGPGAVTFTAAAHTGAETRVATVAVGPLTFSVTQAGSGPQTVVVTSEPALQAAVAALTSNTTIVVAPGRYRLSQTLRVAGEVAGDLAGVVIKGQTGRATDVVLEGAGMTVKSGAATAVQVSGRVEGLVIADLTIQQFAGHAIRIGAGAQAPHLRNLQLRDTGAALVQATGVADGLVEHVTLGYTTTGASAAAAGITLQEAAGWTIRASAFRNIRAVGATAGAAVAVGGGSSDTTVTQNLFVNCEQGVALGLTDRADGDDHRDGRITNNFFTRTVAGGPGLAVTDSPRTVVAHNTVLTAQTAAPIAYRFAGATDLVVANNLTDGALQARDGAWAIETGNVLTATPALFVDAAAGDLHLRPTATAALGVADAAVTDPTDIDGQPRVDGRLDVGADQVSAPAAN